MDLALEDTSNVLCGQTVLQFSILMNQNRNTMKEDMCACIVSLCGVSGGWVRECVVVVSWLRA